VITCTWLHSLHSYLQLLSTGFLSLVESFQLSGALQGEQHWRRGVGQVEGEEVCTYEHTMEPDVLPLCMQRAKYEEQRSYSRHVQLCCIQACASACWWEGPV
jgi:hypothetical protein